MTRLLIKVSPERDLYVLWSTVSDGPLRIASRADFESNPPFLKLFTEPYSEKFFTISEPRAFKLADEFGSSTSFGNRSYFDWDVEEPLLFIWEEGAGYSGVLTRSRFETFVEIYLSGGDQLGERLKPELEELEENGS